SIAESLRKENAGGRRSIPCGAPPIRRSPPAAVSCLRLRRALQLANHQARAVQLGLIPIQRTRGRSGDYFAVDGKNRIVAGAEEIAMLRIPMVYAAQVRAVGAKCGDAVLVVFDHPRRSLLHHLPPSVESLPPEHQLDW